MRQPRKSEINDNEGLRGFFFLFLFLFPFDKPLVAQEKPAKEGHKDGTCALKQVHVFFFFVVGS